MLLRVVSASGELLEVWRDVHNTVIAAGPLTSQEVAERAARFDLSLAYLDDLLVGNATVRAPEDGAVTVIVRILPEHRRRGLGSEYLLALLAPLRDRGIERINTVVLAANVEGLAFAYRHGFVEVGRYVKDAVAYIELELMEG